MSKKEDMKSIPANDFWTRVEAALGPSRTGRLGLAAGISLVASFVVMVVAQLIWEESGTLMKFSIVVFGVLVTLPLIRSMFIFVAASKRSRYS